MDIHVSLCLSLFLTESRYDSKSYRCSRRSRNPEAAPVSRAGHGRCGPFLFMKLPINACWQGFPFHSSTCPTGDRVRHIHILSFFFSLSHIRIFIIIFFPSRYITCIVMLFTRFFLNMSCNIKENILVNQRQIIINVN